MDRYNFIFSGGSITDSVWPTWKNFVLRRYNIDNFVNNAYAGVGNEFLVDTTIHQCKKHSNPFVLIMLTNIDKWDWYVQDPQLAQSINQHEKHPVRSVDGDISKQGFWSTGSWFPKYKELYKEQYYSEEYFVSKTLKNIYVLQNFLVSNNIPNIILFDSPILECTEQTLNTGKVVSEISMGPLSQIWFDQINWSSIYKPGLIGFCDQHQLEWYNLKYKGHPPTKSHWEFSKTHIFPVLDNLVEVNNDSEPIDEINKFQKLFYL